MKAEENARFVYFLVALNILPHSVELPHWVIFTGLLFVLWKYATDHFKLPVPNRWVVHGIGALVGLGVFLEYGTIMGDEASASVLVIAVSLKLFEVKRYRDIMIVTILCYFLLMSKLISSQSIPMTIFMLIDLVLITSLLALHHSPVDQGDAKALIRRSFRLAILSSPIVAALFVVFPRFNIGLGSNTQRNLAEMGFSDRLDPGSISSLMQSDQLIFRARFPNNDDISSNQMYWRGAVLTTVDELRWNRDGYSDTYSSFHDIEISTENSVVTEIHMEPQAGKNLFVLDWPVFVKFPEDQRNFRVKKYSYHVFESRLPFVKREYYSVYSNIDGRDVEWEPLEEEVFLQTGNEPSEKVKELLKSIKKGTPKSAPDYVRKIYDFYSENKFRYSLKNPQMESVDDFLFGAKQGFCEHFAGVTALLLRHLGVPSRVIVGFQGGKTSFLGDYINVRALDAHAWTEYYDKDKQMWVRIDPTVIVAPLRIAGGADNLLDDLGEDSAQRLGLEWVQKLMGDGAVQKFFAAQMIFDQIDASWSNFLLKYDFDYQKEILRDMGLSVGARWLLGGLAALFLVIFLGVLLIMFSKQRSKGDQLTEVYWKLLKKIHRAGLLKYSWEGPADFADRTIEAFPEQEDELKILFADILDYRYSRDPVTQMQIKHLKMRVNKLKFQKPIVEKQTLTIKDIGA